MTKSKSNLFLAAFCLIVALAGVFPVSAQNHTSPGVKTEAELLAALDNSLWVADGKPAEKQIYVLAAPWCGHSQSLYKLSRKMTSQVQFRWIETAPRSIEDEDNVADAAVRQNATVLDRMYEKTVDPPHAEAQLRNNAVRYNTGVDFATGDMIDDLMKVQEPEHGGEHGVPTLIWLSKDGVRVFSGEPERLDTIVKSVVARPQAANISPAGRKFLSADYHFESIPAKDFFAKADGTKLFSFPDSSSQVVLYLAKNIGRTGNRRVTVGGETWIELTVWNGNVKTDYVRESDVYTQK